MSCAIQPVTPKERYEWVAKSLGGIGDKLARVLPPSLPVQRFSQIACNALRRNPTLLQCDLDSIVATIQVAADLGLEIGGPSQEAFLVPFWDGRTKRKVATFIAGYRGLIKLAKEDPEVVSIEAHVVRDGDSFSYEFGTNPHLKHVPMRYKEAQVTHAWSLARFRSGASQFDVLPRAELDEFSDAARKKAGDRWERTPWVVNEAEMQKKTAVRRLSKFLNVSSSRFHRAVDEEDRAFRDERQVTDNARRDDLMSKLRPEAPPSKGVPEAEWEEPIEGEDT